MSACSFATDAAPRPISARRRSAAHQSIRVDLYPPAQAPQPWRVASPNSPPPAPRRTEAPIAPVRAIDALLAPFKTGKGAARIREHVYLERRASGLPWRSMDPGDLYVALDGFAREYYDGYARNPTCRAEFDAALARARALPDAGPEGEPYLPFAPEFPGRSFFP